MLNFTCKSPTFSLYKCILIMKLRTNAMKKLNNRKKECSTSHCRVNTMKKTFRGSQLYPKAASIYTPF